MIEFYQIIEQTTQAGGVQRVQVVFTDHVGIEHRRQYDFPADADVDIAIAARASDIENALKAQEVARYLSRIEKGKNVIGEIYNYTTQPYRANKFLVWVKEKIGLNDFMALKHTPAIVDQFTEFEIDTLVGEGQGAIVKTWAEKIKNMNTAVEGLEV